MTVTVSPLRNLLRLRLRPLPETTGLIVRVRHDEAARWADVLGAGPECRDYATGRVVMVNSLIGTVVGEDVLVAETDVLGHEDEGGVLRPARGRVLVRKAETEETMGGGKIIIPQASREALTAYQVIIEDIGLADICEDKDCERPHNMAQRIEWRTDDPTRLAVWPEVREHQMPTDLRPDAWAIVRPRSFVPISDTDPRYFVRVEDVEAVLTVAS